MCGRTHGQPGLPITFGFKAAVWASELARHRERLAQLRPRVEVVQLGGALGTMEFWGEQALPLLDGFAARLGLGAPDIPWITARDRVAEFLVFLALVTGTLAKIGNEVFELQRPEIGEVGEPIVAGTVGSITMPHKRNPEFSEQLDTLARVVRARRRRRAGGPRRPARAGRAQLEGRVARCCRRRASSPGPRWGSARGWWRGCASTPSGCAPTSTPTAPR